MASGWKRFTGNSPYPAIAHNSTKTSFAYGNKQDRNFRLPWIQGKRDKESENEIIKWIETNTGNRKPDDLSFNEWLQDGQILCKIFESKFPGRLKHQISNRPPKFSANHNINLFLSSVRENGFPEGIIFEPNDLYQPGTNSKVLETIDYIKNKVNVIKYG